METLLPTEDPCFCSQSATALYFVFISNMGSSQAADEASERPHYGRHSSSWMNRFHRKHDAKYHSEQQPLLADERLEEDQEPDGEPDESPAARSNADKLKDLFTTLPAWARHQFQSASHATQEGSKKAYRACGRNIWLVLLAIALTLIAIIVAMPLGFIAHHKGHKEEPLCTSPSCVHAASQLLHSLSPQYKELDPCTQFDKLACEGFEERHDLRPDQSDMFRGTLMAEEAEITLRHILETDPSSIDSADRENFDKLKDDYDACMDETAIRKQGLKPLTRVVDKIKSIYPMSDGPGMWRNSPVIQTVAGQSSTSKDLTWAYLYMVKNGLGPMVELFVGVSDLACLCQLSSDKFPGR